MLHLREKLLHASADGNIVAQAVLAKTGVVKPDMKKQLDLLMGMYLLVDALTTPGSSLEKNEADGVSGLVTMLKKQAALGNDTARAILAVKEKNDLDQIISLVGRIEEKQDPFTTSLCSSLVKLSTSTPLISTSQSSVQGIVSKVLSVLTHPLEEKNNVSTQALQEKLVAAKQEGNTLATMILAKADEKTKQEIVSLTAILRHIDRPEEGADATQKASYQDLRERLEKEQKNHNGLASEVLSAAHLLTANAVSPLEKTTLSVMLWEKLSEQASANNEVAKTVLSRVEELQAKERLNQLLRDLLVSLAHPERITDEKRKKQLTSLQEALRDGREKGNEIAKLLSDAIEQSSLKKATTNSLDALETQLEKSALAGESLAKEFLSVLREDEKISAYFAIARVLHALVEPNDVVFPEDRDRYKQLHASLQEAAEKDSLVGMSVLAASERIGTQGDDMSEAKKLHELLEHDGSDIAQEVRAQIDNEKRAYDQTLVLRTILHGIMHPEYLPDQKRQQAASVLGKQIALEAQHGNTSSKLIQKILHELDALGESANELTTISHLYSVLRKEKEDGNPRATDILALITAEETGMRAQRLAEVLENIADPKRAPGEEQSEYIKLREALVTAETSGDAIAKLLLSISQAFGAKHVEERDVQSILSLLLEKLTAEKELGNSFAMSILALMKPQEAHEKVDDIEKALIAAKEHDDPIAKAVFAFADTRAEGTLSVDGVVVPAENRVQEVNLDDYEAVRSMWAESYRSLDVPIRVTGEHMSRAAWLQDDIAHMQETIDLLGSTDTAKVNEGMQKVSDILPFLLIGGFSSSEIVAYLKAKLEAAKSVMAELEGEKEQVTVRKDAKVEKTISVDEKSEV
ncbi:MAG: hypothetical protein HYV40_01890 [Candidatus Levybacteria bacterium]|nr:hypothetical protein [Candidatus Levybacteria bacterium]